jgi:hypothetical protein
MILNRVAERSFFCPSFKQGAMIYKDVLRSTSIIMLSPLQLPDLG